MYKFTFKMTFAIYSVKQHALLYGVNK